MQAWLIPGIPAKDCCSRLIGILYQPLRKYLHKYGWVFRVIAFGTISPHPSPSPAAGEGSYAEKRMHAGGKAPCVRSFFGFSSPLPCRKGGLRGDGHNNHFKCDYPRWVFGIHRERFQIWGCAGGFAARTPPNLATSTATPNEPYI